MKLMFIGKDGSMGFKRGKTYDCEIGGKAGSNRVYLCTISDGKVLMCPYSSLKKLFENWLEVE